MKKLYILFLFVILILLFVTQYYLQSRRKDAIIIGINAPVTGTTHKVGKGTINAVKMWLDDIEKAGGILVSGRKYPVDLVIENNHFDGKSAVYANRRMIARDNVLIIIGPQASQQAIPAGGVANNYKTPMISPWSSNPFTTMNRPYVFRTGFLDSFRGPALARFIKDEFKFKKAAVLYNVADEYQKGIAEFFQKAWVDLNGPGSVAAYESFTTMDADFGLPLSKIIQSEAQVLFTPQYYYGVAFIVKQARELGWKGPIVGCDTGGLEETIRLCGAECYGMFFSTHFSAAGAKGAVKEFVDRYNEKYGYVPDDISALTWDALNLAKAAIESIDGLTGNIEEDRTKVRDALAKIKYFKGITGEMTFTENGDPIKCIVISRINEKGEYDFYKTICP